MFLPVNISIETRFASVAIRTCALAANPDNPESDELYKKVKTTLNYDNGEVVETTTYPLSIYDVFDEEAECPEIGFETDREDGKDYGEFNSANTEYLEPYTVNDFEQELRNRQGEWSAWEGGGGGWAANDEQSVFALIDTGGGTQQYQSGGVGVGNSWATFIGGSKNTWQIRLVPTTPVAATIYYRTGQVSYTDPEFAINWGGIQTVVVSNNAVVLDLSPMTNFAPGGALYVEFLRCIAHPWT